MMRKLRSSSDSKAKPTLSISAPINVVSSTSKYVSAIAVNPSKEDIDVFLPTLAGGSCQTLPPNMRLSDTFPDKLCKETPDTGHQTSKINSGLDKPAPDFTTDNKVKSELSTNSVGLAEPSKPVTDVHQDNSADTETKEITKEVEEPALNPENTAELVTDNGFDTEPADSDIDSPTEPSPGPLSSAIPESDSLEQTEITSIPEMTVIERSVVRRASADPQPQSCFHCCPNCQESTKRALSAGSRITTKTCEEPFKSGQLSVEERLDNLTMQMKELGRENRELRLEIVKIYSILCQKTGGTAATSVGASTLRRIRKIDIGQPTNFQHTSHLGSSEVTTKIDTLEVAMKNKGGYIPGVTTYSTEPAMPTRPVRREE